MQQPEKLSTGDEVIIPHGTFPGIMNTVRGTITHLHKDYCHILIYGHEFKIAYRSDPNYFLKYVYHSKTGLFGAIPREAGYRKIDLAIHQFHALPSDHFQFPEYSQIDPIRIRHQKTGNFVWPFGATYQDCSELKNQVWDFSLKTGPSFRGQISLVDVSIGQLVVTNLFDFTTMILKFWEIDKAKPAETLLPIGEPVTPAILTEPLQNAPTTLDFAKLAREWKPFKRK